MLPVLSKVPCLFSAETVPPALHSMLHTSIGIVTPSLALNFPGDQATPPDEAKDKVHWHGIHREVQHRIEYSYVPHTGALRYARLNQPGNLPSRYNGECSLCWFELQHTQPSCSFSYTYSFHLPMVALERLAKPSPVEPHQVALAQIHIMPNLTLTFSTHVAHQA